MEAVQCFGRVMQRTDTRNRTFLIGAVVDEIENVDQRNRHVSEPVVLIELLCDLIRNGEGRDVIAVINDPELGNCFASLLQSALVNEYTVTIEQYTVVHVRNRGRSKRTKKTELPHFAVSKVKTLRPGHDTVAAVPGGVVESVHRGTSSTVTIYFVAKDEVDSFTRSVSRRYPERVLLSPHHVVSGAHSVTSYQTTLDLLFWRSIDFLCILREHVVVGNWTLLWGQMMSWTVDLVAIHRSLWCSLNESGNVFKIVDRQIMSKYRDKLTASDSPWGQMMVSLRNGIYRGESVTIRSQCRDMLLDLALFHLKVTYEICGVRILEILNQSQFGRDVLSTELIGEYFRGFELVTVELEDRRDGLMEPVRSVFVEHPPSDQWPQSVRRNIDVLIALYESHRVFAEHLFVAKEMWTVYKDRNEPIGNVAIVMFRERGPLKQAQPTLIQSFLKEIARRFQIQMTVHRVNVKSNSHNSRKPTSHQMDSGYDLQRVD